MSHFDKTAEEVYDHNQQAADKASTQRQENYDFYLKDPASLTDVQKSKVQKIVFLSHGVPLLFWKLGPHTQEVDLLSRDSKVLSSFFPHYNTDRMDPLHANTKNKKPGFYRVFPVVHVTDGYEDKATGEWVAKPRIKFWKCTETRANEILAYRITLLIELYRKAEAALGTTLSLEDYKAKGYRPVADLESLVANKTWAEVDMLKEIPRDLKNKASLVGFPQKNPATGLDDIAYRTFTVTRSGKDAQTKYSVSNPSLAFYNWKAVTSKPSKQTPGEFVEVPEYTYPSYRGNWGKIVPGSLASELFTKFNTELESPDISKSGEADALAIFVYSNIPRSAYAPFEGITPGSVISGNAPVAQVPAAITINEKDMDDVF